MPTNRTRRRHLRRPDLHQNDRVLCKLEIGADFLFLDDGAIGPDELDLRKDPAAYEERQAFWRQAWEEIGDFVLERHIHGHTGARKCDEVGKPGTRPWGFWMYAELPEPRPEFQHDHRTHPQPVNGTCWVGDTSQYLVREAGGDWELEVDYLRRHDLLTDHEKAVLA